MRWAYLWVSAVAAAMLLLPATSMARVPTRLVYIRAPAASDCPDESAVSAAVAARLGYEPFSPWGDQTILATVTRAGAVLVARAELVDHDGIAQGSREVRLAKTDCAELILALALAISISLDPLHVDTPAVAPVVTPDPRGVEAPIDRAPREPDLPPAVVPDEVAAPRRPTGSRAETARKDLTWHVQAAAIGTYEAAPELALGARLGITAQRGPWSLGAEGWSTLPSSQATVGGGEVRVRVVSASLAPCYRIEPRLAVCALGSLGSMHAEGRGITTPRTENLLYAVAGGRALFGLSLGSRVELIANADVGAVFNRPQLMLAGRAVWRPGPASALIGIGASVRFF